MQKDESLDGWKQMWEAGKSAWHKSAPHDYLIEYFGQCANSGRETDVLVPLCGKSVDLKWLYEQGCRVCGVEVSELATRSFFDDQGIKYTRTTAADDFVVYRNEDERISIFCGDFFKFSKAQAGHQFDFVWDRGSFVAINISDRKRYVDVLANVLLPTGRILLSTANYDPAKWPGPPHFVTPEDIHTYFDSKFHINHLNTRDASNDSTKKNWGLDWFTESCYMLSVKS